MACALSSMTDRQLARFGKREDRVHIRCEAVEMHDHDGARPRRYAAFEFGWINVVGFRTDVREYRPRAESADGASRGHKCKRRQEHFVSTVNAACPQGQDQRVRSGSNADAVSDAAEPGDLFFQRSSFAAQHKLMRGHHALDGRSNLTADRGVLRGKIKLRHRFRQGIGL